MRIALLGNASVVHTQRWAEWFRARGHVVEAWSLEKGPQTLGAHRLHAAPLPGVLRYPLAVPALRAQLARFAPDLVDAHYVPNYGLMGVLAGRRPLSVAAWGSDLLVAGGRDAFQRARTRYVLERAQLVIGDSGNLAAAARALGAPRERVVTMPWGVDTQRFHPAAGREPGLLVSTRMHEPVYDLATLLSGIAPIMAARAELRLVVTGAGRETGALERLAREVLPEGRWSFAGRIGAADMAALLARADVYLSASRSDSTSVSLLEAMASGAVPVVSDIDGNREWVGEGDGARLFAPGDPAAAGAALARALEAPGWREDARARNRRVILERGDAATNMARIEALFEALAEGDHAAVAAAAREVPA